MNDKAHSPLIFQTKETAQKGQVILRIRGTNYSWQFPEDVANEIIIWNDNYDKLLEALEADHKLIACGDKCETCALLREARRGEK
jgi:hypothetical protein